MSETETVQQSGLAVRILTMRAQIRFGYNSKVCRSPGGPTCYASRAPGLCKYALSSQAILFNCLLMAILLLNGRSYISSLVMIFASYLPVSIHTKVENTQVLSCFRPAQIDGTTAQVSQGPKSLYLILNLESVDHMEAQPLGFSNPSPENSLMPWTPPRVR